MYTGHFMGTNIMRLQNLMSLMTDMHDKLWHIAAFSFDFGAVQSTVLVFDSECFSSHFSDTIAKLKFCDNDDANRSLVCEASSDILHVGLSDIRNFFNIPYSNSLNDLLTGFYNALNHVIPAKYPDHFNDKECEQIRSSQNAGDNNNGECIFAVKHNPNNGQRSPFNNDKAKRLCIDVYNEYCTDTNISFCFRENHPLTLEEIRINFAKHLREA